MTEILFDTVEKFIAWANEAMIRKDWSEAVKRWALIREKFPEHRRGYVGGATALKESEEFDAADTLVREGLEKFPKEPGLYIEYGYVAMRQKAWEEAAKRWALMREKCPWHKRGYIGGVMALKEQKNFDAADALVLEGLGRFPKEPDLYLEYINIARRQQNNREIMRREAFMKRNIGPSFPTHKQS